MNNASPRAAFGVTPQGAQPVARQSRFHGRSLITPLISEVCPC